MSSRGRGRARSRSPPASSSSAAATTSSRSRSRSRRGSASPSPSSSPSSTSSSKSSSSSSSPATITLTEVDRSSSLEKIHKTSSTQSNDPFETDPTHHIHGAVILEKGHWNFYYRPKVGLSEVKSINDVQRFYIMMMPTAEPTDSEQERIASLVHEHKLQHTATETDADKQKEKQSAPVLATDSMQKQQEQQLKHGHSHNKYRLWVFGSKSLPQNKGGVRANWSMIETVGSQADMEKGLGARDYETPVSEQQRHVEPARPCGHAVYELVSEGRGGSTHFIYHLQEPESDKLATAQSVFNIQKEGRFGVNVKNPNISTDTSGARRGGGKPVHLPQELQQVFEGKKVAETRFVPLCPSAFLDHEGVTLLLFPSRHGIEQGMGSAMLQELEEEAEKERQMFEANEEHHHTKSEMVTSELRVSDPKLEKPVTEGTLV